jgi:hypothetical protein
MHKIVRTRVRYGYLRVLTILRRDDWAVGKKLVYLLYCEERHYGAWIDFSRQGKLTDNTYIETFNGSLRNKWLNVHWFKTICDTP